MTNIGENNKLKPELEASHCQDVKIDKSYSTSEHHTPMPDISIEFPFNRNTICFGHHDSTQLHGSLSFLTQP